MKNKYYVIGAEKAFKIVEEKDGISDEETMSAPSEFLAEDMLEEEYAIYVTDSINECAKYKDAESAQKALETYSKFIRSLHTGNIYKKDVFAERIIDKNFKVYEVSFSEVLNDSKT